MELTKPQKSFSNLAFWVLIYNLAVIVWGTFVRATGSGAACGAHWPDCNGEIIPRAPSAEVLIEYSHRATSGIALILVVWMFVWGRKVWPKGTMTRSAINASLVLILLESAVGAGLVLLEMTGINQSIARGGWITVHLINTFCMVAAMTLAAWWSRGYDGPKSIRLTASSLLLASSVLGMFLVGTSGAITALGDTLFPVSTLAEGWTQDFSPAAHLFVRLRIYHPIMAVVVGALIVASGVFIGVKHKTPMLRKLAVGLVALFALQIVLGVANVLLLAPFWLQMVHLLVADLVWMTLVIFTSETLSYQSS